MNFKFARKLPLHFWFGLTLALIFWYLNWTLTGLRTQWGFFPLWLGYSLTVDGLVFYRKGTSLLKRSVSRYISLFIISVPVWWLFELFNYFTQNWSYLGRQYFSDTEFALLASLSFSTVMPAVFGTAELVSDFKWIKKLQPGWKLKPTRKNINILFSVGLLMLILIFSFPRIFYIFTWISLLFIMEPLNIWMKNRSLLIFTQNGNWRPVFSLIAGCLICGFFWEMWNYYSYPKWVYDVPGVNFWHIFEMPLLGYLGYIPFSLELYAAYNFIAGLTKVKNVFE